MNKADRNRTHWLVRACTILTITLLAACGGGGSGGDDSPSVGTSPSPQPNPPPSQTAPTPIQISGSVGDGPITGATLRAFNRLGTQIANFGSDGQANYTTTLVESASNFPIQIRAQGGTDIVTGTAPDFELVSAIMTPTAAATNNLNPHSTMMVKSASRHNRGLDANSLASARTSVMNHMNFGLEFSMIADPMTMAISESNVAAVVKASESFGEMIRRTRDALVAFGYRSGGAVVTGDAIMAALAADLIDGVIDGRGASGTDRRIAAVASIATAQVLYEAMLNRLFVGGSDATSRMDNAIRLIRPNAPADATTANVGVPLPMLIQAAVTMEAAATLTGDPEIGALLSDTLTIGSGSKPAAIRNIISESAGPALAGALTRIAGGAPADIDTVNRVVRTATPEPTPLPPPPPPPPPPDPGPGPGTDPPPSNGTATMSWIAPTEREDGTPLNNLAGFKIYYGQSENQLSELVVLDNPGLATYVIDGLEEQSTWYFALSAFDSEGRESARSAVASKTFP